MQNLPQFISDILLNKESLIGTLGYTVGNDYWRYFHDVNIIANRSQLTDTFFESDEYSFLFSERNIPYWNVKVSNDVFESSRDLSDLIGEGLLHPDAAIVSLQDIVRFTDYIKFTVNMLIPAGALKSKDTPDTSMIH